MSLLNVGTFHIHIITRYEKLLHQSLTTSLFFYIRRICTYRSCEMHVFYTSTGNLIWMPYTAHGNQPTMVALQELRSVSYRTTLYIFLKEM